MKKKEIMLFSTFVLLQFAGFQSANAAEADSKQTSSDAAVIQQSGTEAEDKSDESNEAFAISAERNQINKTQKLYLETKNAPSDETTWTSSNPAVAEVNNGFVFAKSPGTVDITAVNDGKTAAFTLTVSDYTADQFDTMRSNYSDLLGELHPDYSDPNVKAYMDDLFAKAKEYWDMMDKNKEAAKDGKAPLFDEEYQGGVASKPHVRDIYFFKIMAQAFLTDGSPYQYDRDLYNDLKYGVEWWLKYTYTGSRTFTTAAQAFYGGMAGEIEGAAQLNNFVTLMYDYLSADEVKEYSDGVMKWIKDPSQMDEVETGVVNMTGSNRLDFCKNYMVANILQKNKAAVEDSMSKAFADSGHVIEIVKSGDGFYYDGSTVFHGNKAYTSGYGRALIAASGAYLHVLEGVPEYESYINDKVDLLSQVIMVNYVPAAWQGILSDVTAGRGISRQLQSAEVRGLSFINGMVMIGRLAKDEDRKQVLGTLKYWVEQNPRIVENLLDPTSKEPNYPFVKYYNEALKDDSIASISTPEKDYAMNQMAKFFHNRKDYSFNISMYNDKITNTEVANTENSKGFHLGDGWTVLNNSDLTQYLGDTYATIDWKRLPGTTVDTLPIDKLLDIGDKVSPQQWVGGSVIDGRYGACGMILDKSNSIPDKKGYKMDLKANKSWFTFDDEIVEMGSGITSTQGRSVETTVENRKILPDASNEFEVNGKTVANGSEDTVKNAKYAHLSGNTEGSDIGYYFPAENTLHVKSEARSGYWKDINAMPIGFTADETEKTDNYATMWFDHGVDPDNSAYSYVLLPGMNDEQVKAYAEDPQVEILAQTKDVHAVRHNGLHITAINNFSSEPVTVEGITVDKEASVMVRTYEDGSIQVSAMSPIRDTEEINVTLDSSYGTVISKDANIKSVDSKDGKTAICIQTKDADKPQNTWNVRLQKSADKTALNNLITKASALKAEDYSEASWQSMSDALVKAKEAAGEDAAQEEIDAAADALQKAMDGLEKNIPVTSFKLGAAGIQVVKAGKTLDLAPAIAPEDATDKTVTYTFSKDGIVTVDEKGMLTAVAPDMVKVTAACGGQTAAVTVRVTQ